MVDSATVSLLQESAMVAKTSFHFSRSGATSPLIAGGVSDFQISLEAKPAADDFFSERLATIGHRIFISDSVGAPLFSESQITS